MSPAFKNNKYWTKDSRVVFHICLSGIFISIGLVVKLAFNWIPNIPVINASVSPVYPVGIIVSWLSFKYIYALAITVITPLLWLATGTTMQVDFGDFTMEYWIPYMLMSTFYFINHIRKVNTKIWFTMLLIVFWTIITMGIRSFLTIWAGVVYYRVDWYGSLIFNGYNMLFDIGLTAVLVVMLVPSIIKLKKHGESYV